MLSKLFELDDGTVAESPKSDPFSQPTRQTGDEDHTDMNRSVLNGPSEQTELGTASLDQILEGEPKVIQEDSGQSKFNQPKVAGPSDDLFAGILDEEPLADEKIDFFSADKMKAPAPPTMDALDRTGILSNTELRAQMSKQELPPDEKTMVLEEALDPTASFAGVIDQKNIDPIDEALNSISSTKALDARENDEVVDISDILASTKSSSSPKAPSKPITESDLMSELDGALGEEPKKELHASDFAEVFSNEPIQVPEAPTKSKFKLSSISIRRAAMVVGGILLLGAIGATGFKATTEDGLLGFRIDGFSIVHAYRAPSEQQKQEFAKVFAQSLESRSNDDIKKIEEVVSKLENILQVDERNVIALATLCEHSTLLMNWYGVGSPWTQKYENYRHQYEAVIAKVKEAKPSDEMDRAVALKLMALNGTSEAYAGLQESLKKYTTADDLTLLLLTQLAWRLEKTDEAKKYLERVTNKSTPRARFLLATVSEDLSALKTLAADGYVPAKVEAFVRQSTSVKGQIEKMLQESEVLLESVKSAPSLSIPVRKFRGELLAESGDAEKARQEWKSVVEVFPKDVETWMKIANSFESDANWDAAIDAYRSAQKAGSSDPKMIVRLARLLAQRGRVLEAITLLDQTITSQPKVAALLYEKGRVQLMIYQDEAAKKSFYSVIRLEANNEDAIVGLAEIAMRQKELSEAEAYFKKVGESSSHYAESLKGLATIAAMKRQPSQQKQFLLQALKVNPKFEEVYPELVEIFLRNEEDQEAEKLVKQGLQVLPKSPLLKVALARIYQFQGNPEEGLKELEKVAKDYDHILNIQFALVDLNLDKKDFNEAWRIMNSLIAKELREPELDYLKAKAYYLDPTSAKAVGSNESAIRIVEGALVRDPGSIKYHLLAAQLGLRVLDRTSTLEHVDTALKLDPHFSPALLVKGDLHIENGEYEKAASAYQEALKYTRFRSPIYHRLAESFKRMGRSALAIQYYKKVTSERPQDAEPHLELGKLYNEEGRFSAAMKSLKIAIALNPKMPEAYYFLGFIQKEIGDRPGAIESFEKFLSLEPNSTESATIRDEVYYLKSESPNSKN